MLLVVLLAAVATWSYTGVELLLRPATAGPVGRIARRASTLHDAGGAYRGVLAPAPWPATAGASKRALLIGIDGLRADALEKASAPVLHALIQHGTYAPGALVRPPEQVQASTTSGPGWSSILTGVWPDAHGVSENSFQGHRYAEHPAVFEMIQPAWSASLSNWPPVNKLLSAKATFAPVVEAEPLDYAVADAALARSVATILAKLDPALIFVMFGNVDATGHGQGFRVDGAPYLDAIAQVDRQVGVVLDGLKKRASVTREDWLVVVTSDHGGQGQGHNFFENPPLEVARTVFIVSGPSAAKGLARDEVALVDAVPTILAHLRVPVQPAWKLAGRPVGLNHREREGPSTPGVTR